MREAKAARRTLPMSRRRSSLTGSPADKGAQRRKDVDVLCMNYRDGISMAVTKEITSLTAAAKRRTRRRRGGS